jgi:hypothetical protein
LATYVCTTARLIAQKPAFHKAFLTIRGGGSLRYRG